MGELEYSGERLVPGAAEVYWYYNHLARYAFARGYARGKKVLDAGCGEGYGAAQLTGVARQVTGIDVDMKTIQHARRKYASPKLAFSVMDCRALSFADRCFGAVTCFEVFEHIEGVAEFLAEAKRVLRAGGVLVLSTPNRDNYPQAGVNPFHVREYSLGEFRSLLRKEFKRVEVFAQVCRLPARQLYSHPLARAVYRLKRLLRLPRLLPASWRGVAERALTGKSIQQVQLEDFVISKKNVSKAEILVAVCRR